MPADGGLAIERLSVAFEERSVLSELSFRTFSSGIYLVVGPVATGKSTLLRTLAGLVHGQQGAHVSGTVTWGRSPLWESPQARVALVQQRLGFYACTVRELLASALPDRARLSPVAQREILLELLERAGLEELVADFERAVVGLSPAVQRRLAIIRAVVSDPCLLLVDEPTAGIYDSSAELILADLAREGRRRLLVVVTHNQAHAQKLAGEVLLLFEGKIIEQRPTREFFATPRTKAGREFIKTGGCVRPARSEPPPSPWQAEVPSGFFWLEERGLAGLPRPGLLRDIEADLTALVQLGIHTLVGLEETQTVPPEALATHGIAHLHFPVVDMNAPNVPDALVLCERVAQLQRAGCPVAFHCRGGLGRTGTLLAAQLLFGGDRLSEAVRRVRACNPLCIQSQPQLEFLTAFSAAVERHRARRGFA